MERGYDECHHAVYGRAKLTAGVGMQPDKVDLTEETVPLSRTGPLRGICFDPETHTFTIQHTGTYVIDYFVKAFSVSSAYKAFITIAVVINDTQKAVMTLDAIHARYTSEEVRTSFLGNGITFENLRKGDTVKLVVVGTNGLVDPFYGSLAESEVAYLAIHKAETSE